MDEEYYHQWQLEQMEMEQDPEYINWLIELAKQNTGDSYEFTTQNHQSEFR